MTLSLWPPPVHVQRVLRRARRMLRAMPRECRPSLRDPRSYVGLFRARDLLTLSRWSHWPLPRRALAWLAAPPAECARRWRRADHRTRRLLAAELPAALEAIRDMERGNRP